MAGNPLVPDDLVRFLGSDVLHLEEVVAYPAYSEHSVETCTMYIDACRKLARSELFGAYEVTDKEKPRWVDGEVKLHPEMKRLYRPVVELGVIAATRPEEVGGFNLPVVAASLGSVYLMAGHLGMTALVGLTSGAGRLIESFGDEALKDQFLEPMYSGRWTGTMALTEPHAGSSVGDLQTAATPAGDGTYLIRGTKVFISGGEQDLTENIVHLTLARIEGAPPGIRGVSLFAVPKLRPEGASWVDNDVRCTSVFDKIGWKSLPSVQLSFGDTDDCRGWLVGEPHQGIRYMFQMMNEARLMVGLNGIATASVAYQEALAYAKERPQGRGLDDRDPTGPQVPIIEHADVRRMLLRQKAIVEGGLGLLTFCARLADVAEHHPEDGPRREAQLLLDLLIPIAKTFPAEYGFEANTLAIQVHGGYGYTTDHLVEAWWRDQKLNSIHEGTSGIQALDLLGRKAVAAGGEAIRVFAHRVETTLRHADEAALSKEETDLLRDAVELIATATAELGMRGLSGDPEGMLRHAADYLDAFSATAVGWRLLEHVVCERRSSTAWSAPFRRGLEAGWLYWARTELARVPVQISRIRAAEGSFAGVSAASL